MKQYRPVTPGRRGMSRIDNKSLTKKEPEKKLTVKNQSRKGRSKSSGRITTRHKGGGAKRLYRIVDFKRVKFGIPAKVKAIEYDPNRNCFIMLLVYSDGEKKYSIAPDRIKVGDEVICDKKTAIKIGNRLELKNIPVGTQVYDIELLAGQGGKIVRSAGSSATVMANDKGYTHLKLPSTEIRRIKDNCMATIGQVSNPEYSSTVFGKAGRSRHLGKRPTVRGSAMVPADHPHGGGEGRAPIGLRKGPKTPWGKLAYGVKTRKKHKWSDKFIIKRRK